MSFKKSRACVKRQRPQWWSPEGVLSRLQSGSFIMEICQDAVKEMAEAGVSISALRLRAEVSTWSESASWGEQLKTALGMWKRASSGEMVLAKTWHEDFLAAMEHESCDGNAEKAAAMAGVGYGVVLAVLDKRNKCYDADFAEKFRIAELARVGRIRSRYIEMAETGEGKMAQRAQERIIEAALPSLHGQRQEVNVSGHVDHDHDHKHLHLHGVSADLAREVVEASQARIRRINAGRTAMLPADTREDEGRVIDVTPQRQVAKVKNVS